MEEEDRLREPLEQVDEIVVAPHVRQFVNQDGLELAVGETEEGCDRNENHWSKDTDDHGDRRDRRCHHVDFMTDVQPFHEGGHTRPPLVG